MSDPTSTEDQQTLLGIAFADQALIAAHLAMFAGKTGNAMETLSLLHEIADEISNRYQLPEVAQKTMKLRMEKTVQLATAIIGRKSGVNLKQTH